MDTENQATLKENKGNENPMKLIKVAKLTLNVGAGKSEDMLKKGLKLLGKLSSVKPVTTTSKKRIPGWGLRPGLKIGCKVTIRKDVNELLKKLLASKSNLLSIKNFDQSGNFSFGIHEYIDIPGLEYDPDLKIMGLEVAISLERPGFRIKRRKLFKKKVGANHLITKEDAINFVKEKFNVEVEA